MSGQNPSTVSPEKDQGGPRLPKNLDELNSKRRGVKPGSKRGSYNKSNDGRPASSQVVEAPRPAFTPDSVRPVVSLPFNMAFVRTGFEGFLLTPMESENLSHSGAMVFNEWVQVDPKWLALITFGLSLASLAVQKTMHYRQALMRFHQEEEEKKKKSANAATPGGNGDNPDKT